MHGRAARLWETGLLCLAILFLPFPARAWLGEFTKFKNLAYGE